MTRRSLNDGNGWGHETLLLLQQLGWQVGSGSQRGGSQNKTDLSWWSSKTPSQTENLWKLMLVPKESLDKAEFFSIQEGRLGNPFPLAKGLTGLTAGKLEAFTSDRCNRRPPEKGNMSSLRKPDIFLVRLRSNNQNPWNFMIILQWCWV